MNTGQRIGIVLLYVGTIASLVLSFLSFIPEQYAIYIKEISDCVMLIGVSVLTGALNNTVDKNINLISEGKDPLTPIEIKEDIKKGIEAETSKNTVEEVKRDTEVITEGTMAEHNKIVISNETLDELKKLLVGTPIKEGETWKQTK